jgi:4'-phosphopantetheinyl transferase EntD
MLTAALVAMAGPDVRTAARRIEPADLGRLHDSERLAVASAVDRRQWEFASGRVLLRELLGVPDPIPVGPTRAPVLPIGACGSLAHDRQVVVAAVSRAPAVLAIGIDVEPAEPLDSGMARVILRADERGIDAHLAFAAKEAAYKAWSALGGRMLEHHDVRLVATASGFTATVVADDERFDVRVAAVDGRHLALVTVRLSGLPVGEMGAGAYHGG